jgi:hypothetical protein
MPTPSPRPCREAEQAFNGNRSGWRSWPERAETETTFLQRACYVLKSR